MTDFQRMDPSDAFAHLSRIKIDEVDIDGLLHQVAELARQTIPGAVEASITLIRDEAAHSAAFTGGLALVLDQWQYEHGCGPCLQAAEYAATLSVTDMAHESRWPDWADRSVQAGAYSTLSIGMPIHQSTKGALNVYAADPDAFDDDAVAVGETFAEYAAVVLANVHLYNTQSSLVRHMRAALDSRAVIEQAKGTIMGGRHCTADEAFAILRKTSQDTNVKVRDVATALAAGTVTATRSGELPRSARPR
jgi:transcriptional regulator with GAF, ATPase, and Fis domain